MLLAANSWVKAITRQRIYLKVWLFCKSLRTSQCLKVIILKRKKEHINYIKSFTLNEVKSYIQLLVFLYREAISFFKLTRVMLWKRKDRQKFLFLKSSELFLKAKTNFFVCEYVLKEKCWPFSALIRQVSMKERKYNGLLYVLFLIMTWTVLPRRG
jgi:hypothetical protein